jgi:hypothetical protein
MLDEITMPTRLLLAFIELDTCPLCLGNLQGSEICPCCAADLGPVLDALEAQE